MRREAAETLDRRRELCGKLNRDKCSPPKKQRHQLFARDCQVILSSTKLSKNIQLLDQGVACLSRLLSFPAKTDNMLTLRGWPGRVLAGHPFFLFSMGGKKEEILSLNSLQHLSDSAGLVDVQCNKLSQLWSAKAESHRSHKAPDVRMH